MLYYAQKINNLDYYIFDYLLNEFTFISYKPIK